MLSLHVRDECFLITTGEVHTVFGEVSEGIGVLDKINDTFVDKVFIPFQDIRINHTVILEDPFDDPADLPVPNRSPEPTKEQLSKWSYWSRGSDQRHRW
nr:peptidyl-prolyl cis-trans isomerase-like 4 isoform X2 [Oncorhynchus nerka]